MSTASQYLAGRTVVGFTKTICSVHPTTKVMDRQYHPQMDGSRYKFVLEGAPKGEYRTLTVPDCWEQVIDESRSAMDNVKFRPKLVECKDIISCLLNECTVQVPGARLGLKPGIMEIAGEQPTEAELEHLRSMHAAYCDGMIQEANKFWADQKFRNIQEPHRACARWRGYDAPWVTNLGERQDMVPCYECAEKILSTARRCKHCKELQPWAKAELAEAKAAPAASVPVAQQTLRNQPLRPPQTAQTQKQAVPA